MADYSRLAGKHILVTGGTGYIGSHTVIRLIESGATVTIIDNLINSKIECLNRVKTILNQSINQSTDDSIIFHKVDLRDKATLEKVFDGSINQSTKPKFDAVIHFAGLKAVGESVSQPLAYYECNVFGTINLLQLMDKYECKNLVFSSSATVYGLVESNPITETFPLSTTNPYGTTKLVIENMLREVAHSDSLKSADQLSSKWCIAILRYFNPIGAHASGTIGEDPAGIPNNLLPYVLQVAVGRREHVTVFGDDWPTKDKTGVRDYIHVVDLADGHLAALANAVLDSSSMQSNCESYNLGTGVGSSVLDIIHATEKASGRKIAYKFGPRRPGDIAACYADPVKANEQLKWKATRTLDQAVQDSWKWQQQNPNGFPETA